MDGRKRSELKRRSKSTHKWFITLWSVIICTWLGLAASYFVIKPSYGTETQLLLQKDAATARDLLHTRAVQQKAADAAGIKRSELQEGLQITQHQGSRVVTLKLQLAQSGAAKRAEKSLTAQLDQETGVKVLSAPAASKNADTHLLRNGLISAAVGLLLGLVISFWPRPKYLVTTDELDAPKRERR
jgi:capsular polysaccharide biosynthesis protein